jgi:phospholipase C
MVHPIKHVFVLMLENRSFDHMFAHSGISGIFAAIASDKNTFASQAIAFNDKAPNVMPTDPHHEFSSVVEQLCGDGVTYKKGKLYPKIDNSGFAVSYARTYPAAPPPSAAMAAPIMAGLKTKTQAPALWTLAREFVLCDRWYSSMPGPTWPNRFFVHGASSAGLEHSPKQLDLAKWELFSGFRYPNGSVFDALKSGNWRLYQDRSGPLTGHIPQVAAIKGVRLKDVRNLAAFAKDLKGNYPWKYTFIEPAYGDIISGKYRNGTSQHPLDTVTGGDRLVASVYNALRASPLWDDSLLIITHDEHGGFYDHMAPDKAVPPGDNPGPDHNESGFDFATYGVRVPAVVVSPWVAKGKVDHTIYDHSSVIATLSALFGFAPLTERDKHANTVLGLIEPSKRSDCPQTIQSVALPKTTTLAAAAKVGVQDHSRDVELVREGGNLQGYLFVVRKAQAESGQAKQVKAMTASLSGGTKSWFHEPRTRGDARDYLMAALPDLLAK